MTVFLHELQVADPADAWTRCGFDVGEGDVCRVGGVCIRLLGRDVGTGIVGWSLGGLANHDANELDGIPTTCSGTEPIPPGAHVNGVIAIDHVVLMSPNLQRTVASLAAAGMDLRRQRDAELGGRSIRQLFYRLGEVVLEVVGEPESAGDGPSTLWGITYVVTDIAATAAFFADHTAPVKDAVQPGRRITTLRNLELGMSVRTAMVSAPYPRSP